MKSRKTWREKLADNKGLPRVCAVSGPMSRRWGEGTMVIPAPLEVDALMKQVPKGKLVTINELRNALAARHCVTFACPMTTGIFSWIAAHAADEAENAGSKRVTPYWRTLKAKGEINPRYPGGVEQLARRLKAEGHEIEQRGKRAFVAKYEEVLFKKLS
jgi:hypothetical protein